jgi:hypothetical protein
VIQPLEISSNPQQAQAAAAATATGGASPGRDFATLHAAALARPKDAPGDSGSAAGAAAAERIDAPEGETWSATKPGAHYARIISGPRTGQYINLTHGERRGQTFTIENRDGKAVHVYGTGDKEVVVKSSVDTSQVTDAAKHARPAHDQPPKGERWAPVEGHSNYADILEGKRNGLYVNISGGIRDGMAFQIVKKGDKVFHVYGTGKDKQMIQVAPKAKKADAADAPGGAADAAGGTDAGSASTAAGEAEGTTAAPGTGGTSAPSGE